MSCSTNCPTQDCESYGACLRNKGIQIDRFSLLTGNGASPQAMEVRKNASLARYRDMRAAGLEPQSPTKRDMDAVESSLSDKRKIQVTNDA